MSEPRRIRWRLIWRNFRLAIAPTGLVERVAMWLVICIVLGTVAVSVAVEVRALAALP